ncbi:MAG: hypothetical protein IJV28_07585, partial [Paludibacteraceae bacterium]|nr:hypothetical protein [Paludibacteraceae bacterium]
MKAKRFIDVTAETRKELMKIFKCSTMNVWRALNFESESDECRRIRVAALKKGGHIMTVALECETVHDEVGDKCMRQYFDNGAILEANKATGRTDIYDRM